MITLDNRGQFVTTEGKQLGVIATQERGRWQYRSVELGTLYASGMTPSEFVHRFWSRDDFYGEDKI